MRYLNVSTVFLGLVLLLSTCTDKESGDVFDAPIRELYGTIVVGKDSPILIGRSGSISGVINEAVYIYNPWGDCFYTKYDLANDTAYRFCRVGHGPGEAVNVLTSISLRNIDNTNYISVFDNYRCKFFFYDEKHIDDADRVKEFPALERMMIGDAFPLNDSITIIRGIFGDNICMFLKNGKKESVCLESFTKKGDDNVKRILKDANKFVLSPDNESLIRITQNGGLIEGFKIEGTSLLPLFSHSYFDVICDDNLSDTPDSRYGYIDVAASNDKIYALYDGGLVNRKNTYRSNMIHVYDMSGDMTEILHLDKFVESIGVNIDNNRIFALTDDKELVSFNLE